MQCVSGAPDQCFWDMLLILTVYKYVRVIEVIESEDGLVGKVKVQYRIPSLKKKEVYVDIRRLVILPNLNS